MFLKYKILSKLEFGEYADIETLHNQFPNVSVDKFGREIIMLIGMGLIGYNEKHDVSLKRITSVYEYRIHIRKTLFGIIVSVSTIASAIFSFLALLK